jgi:uroporphyrin-III C-methyltransferase
VVRLKGGDPFVFGRGAEEIEALEVAGIDYEVVSGVTSAVAAPAAAGIPVTHRELASSVTFVTGHEDPSKDMAGVDWEWLAQGSGTLVVLMGLERLPQICARLTEGGLDPRTPAAVISRGTMLGQKTIVSTIEGLPEAVERGTPVSPATVVIGEVAGFPEVLASLRRDALPQAV